MSEVEKEATDTKEPTVKINRGNYTESRTASGSKSLNNGDSVAATLEGLTLDELFSVADGMFPENDFRTRYSKLNTGMQRMNIGNRIRSEVNKIDAGEKASEGDGQKKLDKAAKPFIKERDARVKAAANEKAAKVAEAAKAKAEKEAAKAKKAEAKAKKEKEANKATTAK